MMGTLLLLKTYLISLPIFLGIDFLWLGKIAKNFYDREFAGLARTVRLAPAILVYILIPLGLLLLVVPKANGNPLSGLAWGAFYGFVAYGVYDLTNFAILANWSLRLTTVDMIWGSLINGIMGYIMVMIANNLK